MKINISFIVYLVVLHLIFIGLSLHLLPENRTRFTVAEILIVVSIVLGFRIYRTYLRPLNLISHGLESMKDQEFTTKFVPVGQKEVDQLIEVYNGMMEKLRQERVLHQEQNLFLELLIEASPVAILILDFDGCIAGLNPAAQELPGFQGSDLFGKPLNKIHGPLGSALAQVAEEKAQVIRLSGIHSYKCQKAHFMDRGAKRYFFIIEELTEDILKSEKQAYEKVIRMMSHEVNNSTGAINSILQTVERTLLDHQLEDHGEAVQVAIERNEHLGAFMKNFAEVIRLPQPVKQHLNLHDLLLHVYTLYAVEAQKRHIRWIWDLDTSDFPVWVDRSQIEQVLVNLIKNAFEAMESYGKLHVRTQVRDRCLIIEDDGPGIPAEIQPKLFTPFFSTKAQGQGVGLTLVREILINHQCDFSLSTPEPGKTQFRIQFKQR